MKRISIIISILSVWLQVAGSTFQVTNTNINGVGSLAQAIADANADATATVLAPHLIDFSLLTSGDSQVTIGAQLQIVRPMIVDGGTHVDGHVTITGGGGNFGPCLNFFPAGSNPSGAILRHLVVVNSQGNGIEMNNVSNIRVENCMVGVLADGVTPSPFTANGIMLFNGAFDVVITDCVIAHNGANGVQLFGGAHDNQLLNTTISGNASNGVFITDALSDNNLIQNCKIGVNAAATLAWANGANGIHVASTGRNDLNENIISGNPSNGIFLQGTVEVEVKGNTIGLNGTGSGALSNGANGVAIVNGSGNIIGGNGLGDRNIISANLSMGVGVENSINNVILGNFLGTDATGLIEHPNFQGINVSGVLASGNMIGDTTFRGRNVISGNAWHGIFFENSTHDNQVFGNYIGTDSTGNNPLGNGRNGVSGTVAFDILVGGSTVERRNVISGNGYNLVQPGSDGSWFSGVSFLNAGGLDVKGNHIGLGADGSTEIPNANYGIWYFEGTDLTVGGTLVAERNVISSNGSVGLNPEANQLVDPTEKSSRGIYVIGGDTVRILGNYIGVDALGQTAKPNLADGIAIIETNDIIIGGAGDSSNVISGNTFSGVYSYNNTDVTINGNVIGLAADGVTDVGNGLDGIYLHLQDNTMISNNTLSGNDQTGLHLYQSNSNLINGNSIGLSVDQTGAAGNSDGGVRILGVDQSTLNIIKSNTIAYSSGANTSSTVGDGYGVFIGGSDANANLVSQNSIYCNAGLAINLQLVGFGFGATAAGNDGKLEPFIDPAVSTSTNTIGTGLAGDTIEVYTNPSACGCGGEVFLGKTVVLSNGTWSLNHASTDSLLISALAHSASNNTSQFICKTAIAGTISSVSSICEGESIELSVTNHKAGSLLWEIATDVNFTTIVSQSTTEATSLLEKLNYVPNTSGTHYVRVISIVSATERDTSAVFSWEVTGNQSVGTIQGVSTLCADSSLTLSVQNDIAPSYIWSDSSASHGWQTIIGNGNSVSITPTETTAYQVEASTGLCISSSEIATVVVNPLIIGSTSITVDTNDVCENTLQNFTALGVDVGHGATYEWFVNSQPIIPSSSATNFSTSSLVNGDVVTVLVTVDTLCPTSATYLSNSITAIISDSLAVGVLQLSDDTICEGGMSTIMLTNDVASNYIWYDSSASHSWQALTEETISIDVFPSETTSYYGEVKNGRCVVGSDTVTLRVNPIVTGTLSPTVNNDVCEGTTMTFDAGALNMGLTPTYSWLVDGIEVSTNEQFVTTTFTGGEIVTVSVTPSSSCPSQSVYTSVPIVAVVSPVFNPSISLTGDTVLCSGDTAQLIATASQVGSQPIYQWYVNNQLIIGSSLVERISNLTENDKVFVTVLVAEKCAVNDSVASNELTIDNGLMDDFTLQMNSYQPCLDETELMFLSVNSSLPNEDISSYEWYINGIAQGNDASSFSYVPQKGDVVNVGARSERSCLINDTVTLSDELLDFSLPVVVDAGMDIQVESTDLVTLDGSNSINAILYKWERIVSPTISTVLGNTAQIDVNPIIVGNNEFELTVSNKHCVDSAIVTVRLVLDIDIPNAFTPNGDGDHETWVITNSDAFQDIEVKIYNRWGTLLFHSKQGEGYTTNASWNGTYNGDALPVGTYYYIVDLHNGVDPLAGDVSILK